MGSGWSSTVQTRVVITEIDGSAGLFFYSPDVGAGTLVGSWTAQAGTDPYSNAYPAGLQIQDGQSTILLSELQSLATMTLGTGNPNIFSDAMLQASASGTGSTEFDQLFLAGAVELVQDDNSGLYITSSSSGGTVSSSSSLYYIAKNSTVQHNYLRVGFNGARIAAGALTAVQPGTGTSTTNPAVAETWHTAALTASFTIGGAGPDTAPRYRLDGNGGVRLDGVAYTTAATAANTLAFTLPTGYTPTERKRLVSVTNASGYTVPGSNVWAILPDGTVELAPSTNAAGQQAVLDGLWFPVD